MSRIFLKTLLVSSVVAVRSAGDVATPESIASPARTRKRCCSHANLKDAEPTRAREEESRGVEAQPHEEARRAQEEKSRVECQRAEATPAILGQRRNTAPKSRGRSVSSRCSCCPAGGCWGYISSIPYVGCVLNYSCGCCVSVALICCLLPCSEVCEHCGRERERRRALRGEPRRAK